jgi:hypothetical protein
MSQGLVASDHNGENIIELGNDRTCGKLTLIGGSLADMSYPSDKSGFTS